MTKITKNYIKNQFDRIATNYVMANAEFNVGDIVFWGKYSNKFGRVISRTLTYSHEHIGSIKYDIQRITQQGVDIKGVRHVRMDSNTLNPSSLEQIAGIKIPAIVFQGWLTIKQNCEDEEVLCLVEDSFRDSSLEDDEAIASQFSDVISEYGNIVTVRYWVSDHEIESVNDATKQYLAHYYGAASAGYGMAYSEITGYLWTTEEMVVGGHDLIAELKSHVGYYLLLEVSAS